MATIVFECKRLIGTGKRGILPRDPQTGAYKIVVGAFGAYNSRGDFYTTDGVEQLFHSSSDLIRRVTEGKLKAEFKHPEMRPNEKMPDFLRRVRSIDDNRVCATHIKLELDDTIHKAPDGSPVITVISHLIPSGPFGDTIQRDLDNPALNVCFSVRSFTSDREVRGVSYKTMTELITYDYVGEQGIEFAEKFLSPSLEGREKGIILNPNNNEVLHRRTITQNDIAAIRRDVAAMKRSGVGPSNENAILSMESFLKHVPPELMNQRTLSAPLWTQM